MSSLAIPEQVSPIALPSEMMLGSLPYSLPADAMSYSVKIQPTNVSSVASGNITMTASSTIDVPFNSQSVIFDIPTNQSSDTFLDPRFTCLNFRATLVTSALGSASVVTSGVQRGGGYSWFDGMTILGPTGNVLEQINEWALVNDTLLALQMNNSARDGAINYGFGSDTGVGNVGHSWANLTSKTLVATDSESHSYSIPLLSGVLGCTANNFLNIGRLGRLQVVMQTAFQLPISIITGTATTAGTIQVTLSDFSLSLEMVKIGPSALKMLDETLYNGIAYSSGITYRTSATTLLAASVGTQQLLLGVRGSSIKSLFARFQDLGAVSTTNSIFQKFDSKNPMISNFNFNIGGVRFGPQINPLLQGAQAFVELQKAMGNFNSGSYQSGIIPSNYYKLSVGGSAQAATLGSSQNYEWNLGSQITSQCHFMLGCCTEVIARKSLYSGYSAVSSPIFLELNIASAPTNSHNVYCIAMLDMVLIHDVSQGTLDIRI